MILIGLTGGIACGKSTLSAALKNAGAKIVDADAVSRALTGENGAALNAIRAAFGDEVFDEKGLNRRNLGDAVFQTPEKKKMLESILHPMIFAEMKREIRQYEQMGEKAVVLDVPLLYECGLDAWCDRVWCAYIPQKEQLKRLRERDKLTYKQAMARIHSQMPAREKAKRADEIIRTDKSIKNSAEYVLSLWNKLTEEQTN